MYEQFQTEFPEASPFLGLLKIDQIAFCAWTDEDVSAIKKQFRLTDARWVKDEVVAGGYVRGGRKPGEERGVPSVNQATLLFNYDLGIELEILRYNSGHNYCAELGLHGGKICHFGAHVEKGVNLEDYFQKDWTVAAPIIQQVETISHTNDYIVSIERKYRYTIYDTTPLLGVCFKVIERLEA